ncbi:hypothetical protein [Streptomyces sp. NBC_01314]|uniref:hypothetical protein n=1 Tax=Streptomyces sp. NBC_01314 TaxID=2903821 RepID=UPI003092A8F3|nr:hypothetical protein OG622_42910 [Streptomyces sp. NBC_01314]
MAAPGATVVAAGRSEARPHDLADHVADAGPGPLHLRVVDVSDLNPAPDPARARRGGLGTRRR